MNVIYMKNEKLELTDKELIYEVHLRLKNNE